MTSRLNGKENQMENVTHSEEERQRYHDLCASLRPTSIMIPSKETRPLPAYRTVIPASNSSDSDSDGGASLVFISNLYYPAIVIPEDRIKTPRTPQNPYRQTPRMAMSSLAAHSLDSAMGMGPGISLGLSTVMGARTKSPTDEKFFETHSPHVSPSELLVSKYKAKTPKASDFRL